MSFERFIDTNFFIYHLAAADERKRSIARGNIREGIETGNACISYQVVQECLNTALRKAEVALDNASARAYLDHILGPLLRVSLSIDLYHRGLDIQARYRFAFVRCLDYRGCSGSGLYTSLQRRHARWPAD